MSTNISRSGNITNIGPQASGNAVIHIHTPHGNTIIDYQYQFTDILAASSAGALHQVQDRDMELDDQLDTLVIDEIMKQAGDSRDHNIFRP